jgi:tetratricopeptide (TPR) repeat protein
MDASPSEGSALLQLATFEFQCGDVEAAAEHCEAAGAMLRSAGLTAGLGKSLLLRGELAARQGAAAAACEYLTEALSVSCEHDLPSVRVLAAARLALLSAGKVSDAEDTLSELLPRLDVSSEMTAHHLLWMADLDPARLVKAKRLLDYLVEHAPEDCRASMIDNVPLHRDIMRAWEKSGRQGA